MRRLVLATRSAHKVREFRQLLRGPGAAYEVLDLEEAGVAERPEEQGIEIFDTFEANAVAKARYFAARCDSLVLADDSGLCVDALGGAPGVRSRRFSGRLDLDPEALDHANNALLLRRLAGVPAAQRGGRYECVIALAGAGVEATFRGVCEGLLLDAPRGSGGFGYDPVFVPAGEHASFAELPPARKHELSHRARALRDAVAWLDRWTRAS